MKLVDVILGRVTPINVDFWAKRHAWTPRAGFVVDEAITLAKGFEHRRVYPELIVLAIVGLGHGVAYTVLNRKPDLEKLSDRLKEYSAKRPASGSSSVTFSKETESILSHRAKRESKRLSHAYVGTEHLLLAILGQGGNVGQLLSEFGIVYQNTLVEVQIELSRNKAKS